MGKFPTSQVPSSISFYGSGALQNSPLQNYYNRSLKFMLQVLVPNDMPDRERLFYIFMCRAEHICFLKWEQ